VHSEFSGLKAGRGNQEQEGDSHQFPFRDSPAANSR
jgi:hypothetical protein